MQKIPCPTCGRKAPGKASQTDDQATKKVRAPVKNPRGPRKAKVAKVAKAPVVKKKAAKKAK